MKKFLPLFFIVLGIVSFFFFNLDQYLTFDFLKENREALSDFASARPILFAVAFSCAYILCVALSVPGAALLSIVSGFIFGQYLGTVIVVLSATIGASVIFLAAKTAFKDILRNKASPILKKMEKGFQDNAFSYLLFLRLVPIFPFFAVNLAPAFLGVSLRTFFMATFIGIIPGSFVYVSVGVGLDSLLATNPESGLSGLITTEILIAFIGLGALSLIPVFTKRFIYKK